MQRDTLSPEEITSALQVQCNKAAALLICWVDESDHHAEYHRQIIQLRSTFEDSFGFQTTVSYLDPKTLLELQVLSKVSEFAAAHDGRDDLLVVYYAGFVDVGEYCFKKELNERKSRDEIVWEESEKVLRMTVSHVLWIFDGSFLHHLIQNFYLHPDLVSRDNNRVVAEQAEDGNVSTTKELFKIMRAEFQVSYSGDYQIVKFENTQCDSTLDDHIVLQPQYAKIPDRE
ncbi:MAG: hypothetical protein Q9215_008038 [Flavoplaca cf. flavocitrina]